MCKNIICMMCVPKFFSVFILFHLSFVCGQPYRSNPSDTVDIYPVRKMYVDRTGQVIFIGGKNGVLRLNADLSLNDSIVEDSDNENYIQVLTYVEKMDLLIRCGTAETGTCVVTNATSKKDLLFTPPLLARTNKDDSTISHVVPVIVIGETPENVLFVASTYDDRKNDQVQQYLITARTLHGEKDSLLEEFQPDIGANTFQIKLDKDKTNKFQFKNMFITNKFLFLLTTVDNFPDPSRIIKLCTSSVKRRTANSYEDIPIVCKSGDSVYRWIQSGTMIHIQNKTVLVASFLETKSSTSDTVICTYTLDSILTQFLEARMETLYHNCPSQAYREEMYITPQNKGSSSRLCCSSTECRNILNNSDYCNSVSGALGYESILSNETLEAEALLKLEGRYTTIAGGDINGLGVIYTGHGTTEGDVTQFYLQMSSSQEVKILNNDGKTFKVGASIVDIQWRGNDDVFVLTENQVIKLSSQDCGSATTCNMCMELNDAKCGWCITTQKCTQRNGNCPDNFWLSSAIGKCLTVQFPNGVQYNKDAQRTEENLRIIFSPDIGVVNSSANEIWTCVYNKTGKKGAQPPAVTENTCLVDLTGDTNFGSRSIEIRYNDVKIATSTFLFYECKDFDTCFKCAVPQAKCFWCPVSATCVRNAGFCEEGSETTIDGKQKCPQIIKTDGLKIPNGQMQDLALNGKNLPSKNQVNDSWVKCFVLGKSFSADVDSNSQKITCKDVKVEFNDAKDKSDKDIDVKYSSNSRVMDEEEEKTIVEVYKCQYLAPKSCSVCRSLNAVHKYTCDWCGSSCQFNGAQCSPQQCDKPSIERVTPANGPILGGTLITLIGKELGVSSDDVKSVKVSGVQCTNIRLFPQKNTVDELQMLTCITGSASQGSSASSNVFIDVNNMTIEVQDKFSYLVPEPSDFSPKVGILSGGTRITITGKNINIGNKDKISVLLKSPTGQNCSCKIQRTEEESLNRIICITEGFGNISNMTVSLIYENGIRPKKSLNVQYTYTHDPNITNIRPRKSIESGGMKLTIEGNGFSVLTGLKLTPGVVGDSCKKESDSIAYCTIPRKPSRVKRAVVTRGSDEKFTLQLDGFRREFHLAYFDDPTLRKFDKTEITGTRPTLLIQGANLTLGARKVDYSVIFIPTEEEYEKPCIITEVTNDNLTCEIPALDAGVYHVEVKVGYIRVEVGEMFLNEIPYIIVIVVLGAIVLILPVVIIIAWKFKVRRKNMEIEKIRTDMENIEMNIRNTSREEFASMQLNMKDVKGDLVSTGIPYNDYQMYIYNLLFPEKKDEDKKLFQFSDEPSDENHRKTAPQALLAFEELLFNKLFLQSLIGTLERQNKFSMKDKAEFSSVLSVVLLGKMQHFYEVVELLLDNLISSSTTRKQQKTLFRRFDTISKRLLSNWLSLALYPYLKEGGGQQMFMLYKATQTAMEKSPIDAVTLCAKDTLVEEKLLRMDLSWCKPMTIQVDLNGLSHVYECQVLNCDTISQTKAKCLYQIYKNKAASQLFPPSECRLDWVSASGARQTLNDVDISSERKSQQCVKYNTLKHYNVQENSHLILQLDDDTDDEEGPDYENDMKKFKKMKPEDSDSTSPTQVLISLTNDVAAESETKWHLVPPDEGKTAHMMDELYLNRLRHTKLMLLDYIKPVFDNILDADKIPPVVHYLFHKLSDLAKQNNVETDIVNSWKSECYGIKVWSEWIKKPDLVFDIFRAEHVIPCLEVVQNVLVDIFNQNTPKLSKDSKAQKLLFANEILAYIKEVNKFYEKTESADPPSEKEFSEFLRTLSNHQAEVKVRKLSGLGKLYAMINKYLVDIISDLDEDENTQNLNLGMKLDKIHKDMDEILKKDVDGI